MNLTSVHVPAFGRDIDKLVHRQHEKIHTNMDVYGAQASQCHTDGRAGHRFFGKWGAKNPFRTIFLR